MKLSRTIPENSVMENASVTASVVRINSDSCVLARVGHVSISGDEYLDEDMR